MILKEMPFARPFIVRMQCGLERIFLNAYDALDFLENEWPMRAGPFYEQAMDACRAALSGTGSILVARSALAAACIEAGYIPLSESEPFERAATRAA
jgi:hypothetical protein